MKKRSFIILGISALAMAIAVPLAFAGGPGRRGGGDGWGRGGERGARMAEKLGLDAAQAAELKALREDLQTDVSDIRVQIESKRTQIKELWKAATPDRVKLLAAHKEIGALEQQIAELHVDHVFAVKAKLTPEQFTKFIELRGTFGKGKRGWHKGGRGFGDGQGCGLGPCDGSGPGFGPGRGMGPAPAVDGDVR